MELQNTWDWMVENELITSGTIFTTRFKKYFNKKTGVKKEKNICLDDQIVNNFEQAYEQLFDTNILAFKTSFLFINDIPCNFLIWMWTNMAKLPHTVEIIKFALNNNNFNKKKFYIDAAHLKKFQDFGVLKNYCEIHIYHCDKPRIYSAVFKTGNMISDPLREKPCNNSIDIFNFFQPYLNTYNPFATTILFGGIPALVLFYTLSYECDHLKEYVKLFQNLQEINNEKRIKYLQELREYFNPKKKEEEICVLL